MCGLLFSSLPETSAEAFGAALRLMDFRGPDNESVERRNHGWLGHCRLKILDLSDAANQPFHSADGRFSIVFNGEIYNFRELQRRHRLQPRTQCDVEILLMLYERFGEQCLAEFNGMFAFVILDNDTGDIFAARDRLGIKPLYWHRGAGGLLFSSEVRPLRRLLPTERICEEGLRQYRKLRTFFNNKTLFRDIENFPPGHYYRNGRLHRFWNLPHSETGLAPDPELIRELLESAVRYRMIADVPVGTFLSGGLDSTIITQLAGSVSTWAAGSRECNEFEYSRLAATALGVEHHTVEVDVAGYHEAWRYMLERRGEPLSVPNEVLIHLMTQRLREQITVVLSGEGADELFLGYNRIFDWAAAGDFDSREFARLYAYAGHEDTEIVDSVIEPFRDRGSALETVYAFFQVAHLQGLLRRLDFATMLNGVEARVPFVDHRLVEYVAFTDPALRHDPLVPKRLLKDLFRQRLPARIVDRKKEGFPVDLETLMGPGAGYPEFLHENLKQLGIEG